MIQPAGMTLWGAFVHRSFSGIRLFGLGLLLVVWSLAHLPAHAATLGEDCLAIVATNDLHGAIEAHTREVGEVALEHGGLLATSGYLRILRDKLGQQMLLLDAGDLYQGTLVSNLSEGKAIIAAYNALGYDATAVGNHEFDFGPGDNGPANDRLAVLKARMRQADFPFLAANIHELKSGAPVQWPNHRGWILKTVGGIRVGIIGVATPRTKEVTRLKNVRNLEFRPMAPVVKKAAETLRAKGAQLVVLLGHIGGHCEDVSNPRDLSSCTTDSELRTLLEQLPKGTVDAAVGGHTHQLMAHWINGAPAVESGARGRYIGRIDVCLQNDGTGLDPQRSRVHAPTRVCLDAWQDGSCGPRERPTKLERARFMGQAVTPDPKLKKLLAPYLEAVAKEKARRLGVHLPNGLSRAAAKRSKRVGHLVARGMRKLGKADVAVQNLGGVRADLPQGRTTFGDIFKVLPFDNLVTVAKLTGKQLTQFVAHLAGHRGGDPPYLAGARALRRHGKLTLKLADGSRVHPKKVYTVATNDFLTGGGEGLGFIFDALPKSHLRSLDANLRDALIAYLQEHFPATQGSAARKRD